MTPRNNKKKIRQKKYCQAELSQIKEGGGAGGRYRGPSMVSLLQSAL